MHPLKIRQLGGCINGGDGSRQSSGGSGVLSIWLLPSPILYSERGKVSSMNEESIKLILAEFDKLPEERQLKVLDKVRELYGTGEKKQQQPQKGTTEQ